MSNCIFCCCRRSVSGSFDVSDPNIVTVLPTEPGKLQPTPPDDDVDATVQRKPHKDPVPIPDDRQKTNENTEEDGSALGAVNEIDLVLDQEKIEFYDCIEEDRKK